MVAPVSRESFQRRATRGRFGHGTALLLAILLATSVGLFVRPGGRQIAGEVHVIDGDTLRMGEVLIRLKGLDAPEMKQSCTRKGLPYPCGRMARDALVRLVGGHAPRCRVSGRDRYERSLATCFVEGADIGAALVQGGHAVAYGDYQREEASARAAATGLWAGEFERPSLWRQIDRS